MKKTFLTITYYISMSWIFLLLIYFTDIMIEHFKIDRYSGYYLYVCSGLVMSVVLSMTKNHKY